MAVKCLTLILQTLWADEGKQKSSRVTERRFMSMTNRIPKRTQEKTQCTRSTKAAAGNNSCASIALVA